MFDKEVLLKKLTENIRIERAKQHIAQEYLAEKADITPQHLYRIENACLTILVVANIAQALNVTLDNLFQVK